MLNNNGYEFVEQTKYPNLSDPDQQLGNPQPPFEIPLEKGKKVLELPDPQSIDLGNFDLRKAIENSTFVAPLCGKNANTPRIILSALVDPGGQKN